jgi:peptidoglycan L-alanyl-D-glutamate endopeptidase CwlK
MQKELKWFLIGLSAIGITTIIFTRGKKITGYIQGKVWDFISEKRIMTLHPDVRNKAREFINKASKIGINLRVAQATRTYAEQNDLYAQGRTKSGGIVTNAKGGQSSHNFGTAIDVVQIIDGNAKWDADWNKIAEIGKSVGFSWGGDWKTFKDKPHFEMNFGNTIAQLKTKFESGKIKDGFVILT